MEWNRSQALALAADNCAYCHGVGMIIGKRGHSTPCNCVLRGVFRACYGKFIDCVNREKYISRASLETSSGSQRRYSYGRKEEEYVADFFLVSRRHLNDLEFRVFRYHFMLGADWKLCARKLKIDRGQFFHMVYRIEQRLGRVFRELEPYGLYPIDEYFTTAGKVTAAPSPNSAAGGNVVSMRSPQTGTKTLRPFNSPVTRKIA